ncbi:MAG: magnesium transporter CorA family protein [Bacteroidales bacterium]|nr:magnesium transporter CorA family protein [Bacteroidales bacterium]
MSEIKIFSFKEEAKPLILENIEAAIQAKQQGALIWIDCFQPTAEQLNLLGDTFKLHPLAIEDCIHDRQVPKMEDFSDNTFFIFNYFYYINKTLHTDEINFFIGDNYLLSISGINSEDRQPLKNIEKIVEQNYGKIRQGAELLLHSILDYIVDHKFAAIETIEDELEAMEELILEDPATFIPKDLLALRRNLLNMRKCLFQEREILVKICRLDCQFIKAKSIFHYRDIYDHLTKFFELTETYREMESALMELYISIINNQMTKVSNLTNKSVKRLTLITTVFMPLTLLAGIFGMSEWTMMTGTDNWRLSYPLFFVAMIIIAVISYRLILFIGRKDEII